MYTTVTDNIYTKPITHLPFTLTVHLPGMTVLPRACLMHVVVQEAQPVVELCLRVCGHIENIWAGVEGQDVIVLGILLAIDAKTRSQHYGSVCKGEEEGGGGVKGRP